VGVLEKPFYLRTDENAYFYLCSRLCLGIFALNIRILRFLHSAHSQIFKLITLLREVDINILQSCRLKRDVLHSSDLESFLLGVASALNGNTCPSLGCPIHIGSNKISYNVPAAQSTSPQLPGQHLCSTAGLRNIFMSANLERWRRFLSCELHEQKV